MPNLNNNQVSECSLSDFISSLIEYRKAKRSRAQRVLEWLYQRGLLIGIFRRYSYIFGCFPFFDEELPKLLRETNNNPTQIQFLECCIKYYNHHTTYYEDYCDIGVKYTSEKEIKKFLKVIKFMFPHWGNKERDQQSVIRSMGRFWHKLGQLYKSKHLTTEIINILRASKRPEKTSDLMSILSKNDLLTGKNIEALEKYNQFIAENKDETADYWLRFMVDMLPKYLSRITKIALQVRRIVKTYWLYLN